jgi:hypothetical protein
MRGILVLVTIVFLYFNPSFLTDIVKINAQLSEHAPEPFLKSPGSNLDLIPPYAETGWTIVRIVTATLYIGNCLSRLPRASESGLLDFR